MTERQARVLIPTPIRLDPGSTGLAEQIAAIPARAGVYLLLGRGTRPHIAWSANVPRRLTRLLVGSNEKRGPLLARLREQLASIEVWLTGSMLETSLKMYELATQHFPDEYLKTLRLRMPWFVGLTSEDAFARTIVQNRIPSGKGPVFGPFQNRDAAQAYEQGVLSLFQLRRCSERLAPSPEHPGCLYGEINQCLRPCQCAVTMQEYATETQRVFEFLHSNRRHTLATLSAARDRAAEQTDFEQAAFLHKQVEKMKAVTALRDGAIAEISEFHGVALTRALNPRQFRLWPMNGGCWQEPVDLDFSAADPQSRSLDLTLREKLMGPVAVPQSKRKRIEHLALFSRWYYSSFRDRVRDGEWFGCKTVADLNYRGLVRHISSMVKADAATTV